MLAGFGKVVCESDVLPNRILKSVQALSANVFGNEIFQLGCGSLEFIVNDQTLNALEDKVRVQSQMFDDHKDRPTATLVP